MASSSSAIVLVKAYTPRPDPAAVPPPTPLARPDDASRALPPIASFAFASILRAADGPELRAAIDGIAAVCARSRLSLAGQHAAHLPPQGRISVAGAAALRPHLVRPTMLRTTLASVPEVNSSGSEGSAKQSKKPKSLFGFLRQRSVPGGGPVRRIRIGCMGRTVEVGATTALTTTRDTPVVLAPSMARSGPATGRPYAARRVVSEAELRLRRLLNPAIDVVPG